MEPFDLRLWNGFEKAGGNLTSASIIDQVAIDSRRIDSPHSLFVALVGSSQDGHQFVIQAAKAGARYALVNTDWSPPADLKNIILLRVKNPLQALQEIAACYRKQQPALVIGITGSLGKTMLKDLLQAITNTTKQTMASPESFNSQIGVSLSLLMIKKTDVLAIIEAGISQKEEMDTLANIISPDHTILTNIGNSHLNSLHNLATTAAEKIKLVQKAPQANWSILPDDPLLTPHLASDRQNVYFWNQVRQDLPHAEYATHERSITMPYQVKFPDGNLFESSISTGFSYFLDLVNIAVKAAWLIGIPSEAICCALKNYIPDHMRTEIWKSPTGITFINNTYCSDPQSVDLALKHLEQAPAHCRKIFVFGGMKELKSNSQADYRRIGKAISKAPVDLLFLYENHDFSSLIDEVSKNSPKTEILSSINYQDAVAQLHSRIQRDDVVLIKGSKKEPIDNLIESFNDSISNNQCIVNLSAIQANIEALRNHLGKSTRIMAIIKALAYGTDDVRIGKFLSNQGIDIFGVSYVDEGVTLRRSGIKQAIFVINAALYEAAKAVKWDLEVGVSDQFLIKSLAEEAAAQNKQIKVHLHIDTGMGRFGCRPQNALELVNLIKSFPSLIFEGVMTHFTSADDPQDDSFTFLQMNRFDEVIKELKEKDLCPPWQHAANSSAAIRFSLPQYNMVRIGLAIYGLHTSEAVKKALELRLALSLISRIVGINVCKLGETISYGRSYTIAKEMQRIAVLPIGYFDGLHRSYSGKGHVIIRGQKAPMVGRICMDYMMVDVTDIPNVAVGDSVLIFGVDEHGQYLSPENLAIQGNSIAHELVTCLGPRIQRIFINEL